MQASHTAQVKKANSIEKVVRDPPTNTLRRCRFSNISISRMSKNLKMCFFTRLSFTIIRHPRVNTVIKFAYGRVKKKMKNMIIIRISLKCL